MQKRAENLTRISFSKNPIPERQANLSDIVAPIQ